MQTWIVLILVIAAAGYLARRFVRSLTGTARGCEACGYDTDGMGCPGRESPSECSRAPRTVPMDSPRRAEAGCTDQDHSSHETED